MATGFGTLARKMRHFGIDKRKYQLKLIDYKKSQNEIMKEIIESATELAKYIKKEEKETSQDLSDIHKVLMLIEKDAERFRKLSEELRTGVSTSKGGSDQKTEFGGEGLKKTVKKTLNEFVCENNQLEKNVLHINKELNKTEEDLQKVLTLIELLRILIKYYYEVDNEIKTYRVRERVLSRKDRIQIEHETNKEANEAENARYDSSLESAPKTDQPVFE